VQDVTPLASSLLFIASKLEAEHKFSAAAAAA
jgi:hypothetical protein